MVIFIKKIKTKEGINSFNVDKIRKDVPDDYEILDKEPQITYTANHVLVAFRCKQLEVKAAPAKKAAAPKKAAATKTATPAKKKAAPAKA
jgi:hypothetical protein